MQTQLVDSLFADLLQVVRFLRVWCLRFTVYDAFSLQLSLYFSFTLKLSFFTCIMVEQHKISSNYIIT